LKPFVLSLSKYERRARNLSFDRLRTNGGL
jgi:hypothetical protein